MKSKEYLQQIATTEVIDCTNNDKSKKRIANIFSVGISAIEKDLEVLEIIKNHILNIDMNTSGVYLKFHNGYYEPYYTIEIKEGINKIVSIEEYTKLKEWLENENQNKTN